MANEDLLRAILGAAESAVGVDYVWGGNSLARGVDCSGLVQQAFRAAGIEMPRVSNQQARVGQPVASLEEAQPGDLLSWDNSSRNNGADHIAIYLGNGLMIEAPRRGKKVQVVPVRGGATINRVVGVVPPSRDPELTRNMVFGPNQDRQYTNAAVQGAAPPPPTQPQAEPNPEGGLGDRLPPNASIDDVIAYIEEHFPDVAPFMQNDEIKMILVASVTDPDGPWSRAKLDAALQKTEYYRTHTATSRDFDLLLATDRRTAIDLINRKIIEVDQAFQRQGVKKEKAELGEIAKKAIRGGWTEHDLDRFVVSELRGDTALPQGEAAATADSLVANARQYLVPISRKDAEEWALRITEGTASMASFTSWLTGLARARFANQPDILAAIEAGSTPSQYFAGHRQTVAQVLELDADQIDLMDPKWSWAMETVDKQGNRRAPTLGEVAQLARDRPEFADTRHYKSTTAGYALGLSTFLGKAA